MRMLPASIYFARSPEAMAARGISQFSSITHAHPRSRLACILFSGLASALLEGKHPAAALQEAKARAGTLTGYAAELEHFGLLLQQDLAGLPEGRISSGGYVVHTLTAAVWCLLGTGSFRDCVLRAVNLGGDTDTTGAVAGALAGLHYGVGGIPTEWTEALARVKEIRDCAGRLHSLCAEPPPFPDSYWILPGKLLAGEYPGARKPEEAVRELERLRRAGVSFVVDLTEEGERAGGAPLQSKGPSAAEGVPERDRAARWTCWTRPSEGKGTVVTGVVAAAAAARTTERSVLHTLARLRKDMPDAGNPPRDRRPAAPGAAVGARGVGDALEPRRWPPSAALQERAPISEYKPCPFVERPSPHLAALTDECIDSNAINGGSPWRQLQFGTLMNR
jgi:hypothetical protein